MDKKLFIPIILGTVRQGRKSEHAAKFVQQKMEEHADIETELIDPRNMGYDLSNEGNDEAHIEQHTDYRDMMERADGLVIVVPEYNHGYPGSLKLVLDTVLKPYIHKPVGMVGVSGGPWGGTRVIETLVHVVRELGLVATFADMNFSGSYKIFDDKGNLNEDSVERYTKSADKFLTELVWMAKTLRWGRENVESENK